MEVSPCVPIGVVALLGCIGAGRAVAVYGSEARRASKSGSDMLRSGCEIWALLGVCYATTRTRDNWEAKVVDVRRRTK